MKRGHLDANAFVNYRYMQSRKPHRESYRARDQELDKDRNPRAGMLEVVRTQFVLYKSNKSTSEQNGEQHNAEHDIEHYSWWLLHFVMRHGANLQNAFNT